MRTIVGQPYRADAQIPSFHHSCTNFYAELNTILTILKLFMWVKKNVKIVNSELILLIQQKKLFKIGTREGAWGAYTPKYRPEGAKRCSYTPKYRAAEG